MATTIKASCPSCKDVELAPSAFHLTVYDAGNGHFYEFFCPKCYERIVKPADESVQSLLMRGGVEHTFTHMPLELLEVHTGPALTVDDVMDFVVALRQHSDLCARLGSNQRATA